MPPGASPVENDRLVPNQTKKWGGVGWHKKGENHAGSLKRLSAEKEGRLQSDWGGNSVDGKTLEKA